jgi:multidrug resistance efflux pump
MSRREYIVRGAGVGVALLAVGLAIGLAVRFAGPGRSEASDQPSGEYVSDDDQEASAIPVNVVHPRVDPNFSMSITQPAYIAPYYQADLKAQVGGVVRRVTKAIGSRVKTGEPLIVVNAPDVEADLAKKKAVVRQREHELEVAHAMLDRAKALVQVALSVVKEKEHKIEAADATRTFRRSEWIRFRAMGREGNITADVVDERRKFYEAAAAESAQARAGVERARADVLEARAKVREAIADEHLKEQLIEVARKDVEVAQALFDYATVRAPFDGIVTRRRVDPGSFVQNATSSGGATLMTVEKTDLLTVYSHIPDNYAPYVDDRTDVVIELSELAGVQIKAHISRTSHSLQTPSSDRTMRVEVDIYNRDPKTYPAFVQRQKASDYADLKDGKLPVLPKVEGSEEAGLKKELIPGMYGTMKLVLRNFKQARLLPSSAVFSKGGKPHIFIVRDRVAHLVPVEVAVDDGILAKVTLLEKGQRRELRGDEQVVQSRQTELSEGQRVSPSLVKWGADRGR